MHVNDPAWFEPADLSAPAPEDVPIPALVQFGGDNTPPASPSRRRALEWERVGQSPDHKQRMR